MDASDPRDQIRQYQRTRDPQLRAQLIERYMPMIRACALRIAARLPGNRVDYDDLISYATLGFIDALDHFDPDRGVKFGTYADLRVRGGALDGLRQMDCCTRWTRQFERERNTAVQVLEQRLGRMPSDDELCEYMGLTREQFRLRSDQLHVASAVTFTALAGNSDRKHTMENETICELCAIDPISEIERAEAERLALNLYYREGLEMWKIGQVCGLSESRVSQILSGAHDKIRERMQREREAAA